MVHMYLLMFIIIGQQSNSEISIYCIEWRIIHNTVTGNSEYYTNI